MLRRVFLPLFVVLAGQAGAQLVLWTTEVEPDRMAVQERIAADYEAHSGVSVSVVAVAEQDLARRVALAYGARQLPDVIYHPLGYSLGWAAVGVLDPAAAGQVLERLDSLTFSQDVLDLVRFGDNWSAVPASGWTQMLLYRS